MVAMIGGGPPATQPRPRRPRRSPLVLGLLIAVMAFSAVVYVRITQRHDVVMSPAQVSQPQVPQPPGRMTAGATKPGATTPAAPGTGPWRLVFFDDFDGTQLDRSKWSPYGGQPSGQSAGQWSSSHDVVRNGQLVIRGYRDPARGNAIVTGGLSSATGLQQTYGMYQVRMRMDAGRGVSWVALLWPANNRWPPEVDFGEDNGAGSRQLVYATEHYSTPARHDTQVQVSTSVNMTAWHVIGVEWGPGVLRYTIDGKVWATIRNSHVSSAPMVLDLQTQAWGCVAGRWEQCANASTPAEVDLHVDWVAAYAGSGSR